MAEKDDNLRRKHVDIYWKKRKTCTGIIHYRKIKRRFSVNSLELDGKKGNSRELIRVKYGQTNSTIDNFCFQCFLFVVSFV